MVGPNWRKSSYSSNASNCVEVAEIPAATSVAIRDSKAPHIPPTHIPAAAWAAFTSAIVHDTLTD